MASSPGAGGPGEDSYGEKVTEWFWETGPDHRFTYFSNEGADATGLVSPDIIGKRRQDLAADRDDPKWARHLADLDAHRPFWGFEYSARIADGSLAHLSTSGEPRLDDDGRFLGYRGATSDITERRKIERELRDARERFDSLMQAAPFEIVLKDREGKYLQVNRAWERNHGRTNEEAVGRHSREILPSQFAEVFADRDRAVLEGGRIFESEEPASHPDGTVHDYLSIRFPLAPADRSMTAGLGLIAMDITARKQAERALLEREEELGTIADNLPVLMARFDRDWRYRFINREGASWYGMPVSEIVGKKIPDLFPRKTVENIRASVEAVLRGENARFAGTMEYPDGKTRSIEITFAPDRTADGEVQGWFALAQDLTEREKAVQALRESEQQLRTIADNLPAFIIHADSDQRFRFANRAAEQWYGRPASEIIGRQVSEILSPASYEKLRPRIEAVLAGQDVHFEDTLLYPDNVTRTVYQRWIADLDENGHARGWFSLGQDITERKRLEADLLRKERLAAMGQLTGTVAHELRNPLGAVATSIAVIRRLSGQAGLDLERSL
ncbi:MAG: PAS domain-containing protein, partial [Alphaproteobacteria bacterium]|nr:PAS domain-containing protein [Alphaproteobacteria bacterium]